MNKKYRFSTTIRINKILKTTYILYDDYGVIILSILGLQKVK